MRFPKQKYPGSPLHFLQQLTALTQKSTKKQHILVCRAFFELLTVQFKALAPNCRSFSEQLQHLKAVLPQKSLPKVAALTEAQNSELIRAYISNGIWLSFQTLLKTVEQLLNDDIEFVRAELLDSIHSFVFKVPDNIALMVLTPITQKIGTSDLKTFNRIAKLLDVVINTRSGLSLSLVKEVHRVILTKSLKPDGRVHCFMVLSNISFGQLEDQEVIHYTLKVFLDELRVFVEELLTEQTTKGDLLKKKFGGSKKKAKGKNRKVPMATLLQERMERSTKLLNQVFKGINKILPKIKPTPALTQFLEENLDNFFRFCHVSTSRISIQILLFLFQILKTDLYSKVAERYLSLLYGFLDSPKVYESRLLEQFFDLLYTIVVADFSTDRVCAFFKRLFMTTLHCETRVVVATMVFFARVVQERPAVGVLLKNPHQGVQDQVQEEEDEQYQDVELSDGENGAAHKNGTNGAPKKESGSSKSVGYDPMKRNPLYANAGKAGLPEVECLKGHYNPAVRKIATLISTGQFGQIDYKGNPFEDFTNIAILNRIALMQPKKRTESPRTLQKRAGRKLRLEPVSLGNYQDLQFEDEKAIQLYFQKRMETFGEAAKKPKRRRQTAEDEEDAFADDLIQKEMEKYGGAEDDDDEIIPDDEDGEGEGEDIEDDEGDFDEGEDDEDQDEEADDDDDVPEFDSEVEDVPSDEEEEEEEEEAPRRPLLSKRPPKAGASNGRALNKRRKVR